MEGDAPIPHLGVVGAGRVGGALALALHLAGAVRRVTLVSRRAAPPVPLPFPGAERGTLLDLVREPPVGVVVAVPDEAIGGVARELAEAGLPAHTPVLHTSGALGAEALAPLREAGSLHPLAAIPDAVTGAERLRGGWYALEGSESARALGELLVSVLGGKILPVPPGEKPLYHAAAVFASNYVVALLSVGERLLVETGVRREAARAALAELAAGAVENVARHGPEEALTGPVSRGDVETVRRHLERLSPGDAAIYSVLAREALALARGRGLGEPAATGLERLLRGRGRE